MISIELHVPDIVKLGPVPTTKNALIGTELGWRIAGDREHGRVVLEVQPHFDFDTGEMKSIVIRLM